MPSFVICISSLNTQGCLLIKMHFYIHLPNMPKLSYSEIKALIFHIYILLIFNPNALHHEEKFFQKSNNCSKCITTQSSVSMIFHVEQIYRFQYNSRNV